MRKEVEKDQTITKIIQSMRTLELVQPFFTLFEFCDFWGFPRTRWKKNSIVKRDKNACDGSRIRIEFNT